MPKKKLIEYSRYLDSLALSNSTQTFPNKNHEHAAIAISKILKYSRNDFLLFDDDLTGDISKHNEIEALDKSLVEFISREGMVKIVVGNKSEYLTSNFENDLSILNKIFPEQIEVRLASDEFKSRISEIYNQNINFAIGDKNKFRLERIIEKRTASAECSFNNKNIVNEIRSVFNSVYDTCTPYFV